MKRFITYFYLYENGVKSINVGFARVDIRNGKAIMEISVRNLGRFQEAGKICVLVNHDGIVEVEIGQMKVFNGQGNCRVIIDSIDMAESGYGMDDAIGMRISFGNKGFIASCWKEEYADAISGKSVSIRPWTPPQLEEIESPQVFEVEMKVMEEEIDKDMEVQEVEEVSLQVSHNTTYKKIDLSEIHSLPRKNWYLCNNSFLLHGFWNYGYLVLKKEMEENKEKLALGVPGIFEKPEMVMAVLFGFPNFESLPEEMKNENKNIEKVFLKKENQEPKTGDFGCWFIDLNI